MSAEDLKAASRHACEVARWTMFKQGLGRDSETLTDTIKTELEWCANALGYTLKKLDPPVDVEMGR